MDYIGQDLNIGQDVGNAIVVLDGGNAILDEMQMKNVVFQNVDVYYDGGPTLLTNVYFVNCTFHIKMAERSRGLAFAMLSSDPSTTFSGI